MIQFQCDYSEGAHPLILKRLGETNMEQTIGYSEDTYCENAKRIILNACKCPQGKVHFLVGGTQTNTTVISHLLRPYQGAITADSGHINVHETGAIEATGHKVLTLPAKEGKISASQIANLIQGHIEDCNFEHMVQPGLVYISFPTEVGTLYSRQEIQDIYNVCKQYEVPLFIDGARLGYGLCAPSCNITLPQLAELCDIFYIGGTKVGALFGEAVVIPNPKYQKEFRYSIKQHGGMLAKGRLLGIQFETLFTNNLYFEISSHAIHEALRIKQALLKKGIQLFMDSDTNQQFPIFSDHQLEILKKDFLFSFWEKTDPTHTAVRICTSWGTLSSNVDSLLSAIHQLP